MTVLTASWWMLLIADKKLVSCEWLFGEMLMDVRHKPAVPAGHLAV